ncbi:metallo-beta-lactamase superfamily protein [Tricladium varicosporioides]|nr:metallo-beta-lactamase superfamily protein [Hymenoscyphus varicosporioides]
MSIKIEVLTTGSVTIRPTAYTQPSTHSSLRRRLRFLTDRTWMSKPLPIHTFLITHPDGPILFDTGLSPSCTNPNYFPWWAPAIKMMSKLHIMPEEGIASQLKKRGVGGKDLKKVVLSHVHHDHCGGLEELGEVPVWMGKAHWEAFKNPILATLEGSAPSWPPKNFKPHFLEPTGPPIGPFQVSYPITSDGKVVAVDTPGHVKGHISVIVFTDDGLAYFLTGDATYDVESLEKGVTDGVTGEPEVALESLGRIRKFCAEREVVVLPSHDYETVRMLEERRTWKPKV